jgi:hypothetical protein
VRTLTQKEKIEAMLEDLAYGYLDGWLDPEQRKAIADECSIETIIFQHFKQMDKQKIETFYNNLFE